MCSRCVRELGGARCRHRIFSFSSSPARPHKPRTDSTKLKQIFESKSKRNAGDGRGGRGVGPGPAVLPGGGPHSLGAGALPLLFVLIVCVAFCVPSVLFCYSKYGLVPAWLSVCPFHLNQYHHTPYRNTAGEEDVREEGGGAPAPDGRGALCCAFIVSIYICVCIVSRRRLRIYYI